MGSIWENSIKLGDRPKLTKNKNTSVAVIGGGMAGILTAYFLKDKGIDCIVVESGKIGMGITRNTTAKITSQHNLIYSDLIKRIGKENAKKYLDANEHAIKTYKNLCLNIDCDFNQTDSFVYSTRSLRKIQDEIKAVNDLGLNAEFVKEPQIPIRTAGCIKFKNQAQFNPLKFLEYISRDLEIYENTRVTSIDNSVIKTESADIKAENIIIATHFPFINSHGAYFIKMYQHRSYVIAVQNTAKPDGMYIDEKESGLSFRTYKDLLLIGGAGHRTGKPSSGYSGLESNIKSIYPESVEKYRWATQDCITIDNIPYIGKYFGKTDNLFVSTGFNKWGMSSSMVGAQILSDAISGTNNEYASVFSPQRFSLNKKFFIHIGETLKNFMTPTVKRCSHLGCSLHYNSCEDSWDCPCHGSRFSNKGNLIDNPAMKGVKIE